MIKHEALIREVQRRISTVCPVDRTPVEFPSQMSVPRVCLFDVRDVVFDRNKSGGRAGREAFHITYKRKLTTLMEIWNSDTENEDASSGVLTLLGQIRSALFYDGCSLGGECSEMYEERMTQIVQVAGTTLAVVGVVLELEYVETLGI